MKRLTLILACFMLITAVYCNSQTDTVSKCRECPVPCVQNDRDTLFDVYKGDELVLRNVGSALRTIMLLDDQMVQAIKLSAYRQGVCFDTLLPVSGLDKFESYGLGGTQAPQVIHVKPVYEYESRKKTTTLPNSFLELTGVVGYGGKDTTARKIGFNSLYYGGEVLIAPLGFLLGDIFSVAVGGGMFFESSRMRFPVMGHLRFSLPFLGSRHYADSVYYLPTPCRFECSESDAISEPRGDYRRVGDYRNNDRADIDKSAYIMREKYIQYTMFRPFIFVEGGLIFDGSFDGSGSEPSINPEEYGEYFFGGGVGTPLFNWLTVSLGYRYMRLNLRTPCPTCQDNWVVNTNNVHSIILKAGLRLEW